MLTHQSIPLFRVLFVLGTLWGEKGITSHLKTLSKQLINQGFKVAIASDLPSNIEGAYDKAMQAVESFKRDGVTYVEAMASGTAVVASPNPRAREVLAEGEYGILTNDADISKKINCLLQDTELRKSYEQKGLLRSQEFSWDSVVQRYECTYQESFN